MPLKSILAYYLLTVASKLNPPLSTRTVRRFRNSAAKRNPNRTFDVLGQHIAPDLFRGGPSKSQFIDYAPPEPLQPDVKILAHYLPQFHPFPENDEWWGKGFTEWSNVGKAVPNYPDHHQPHCPIHLGYYDLRVLEVMAEQMRLAKAYGIHGFNYYFYWFGGKTLMERPLEEMLRNPALDLPFCLTWANENWTRRWDGRAHDILIGQNHSIEDSVNLLRHVRKYMDDSRYLRIDGKPVLIVYRANIIPDIRKTAEAWRAEAQCWGESGIYLISAQTFDNDDPTEVGFDAAMEFPPHQVTRRADITDEMQVHNPNFTGAILDYRRIVEAELAKDEPSYKLFRSATLSWDNTARNQNGPRILARFSISEYQKWLGHLCKTVRANGKYNADEKIVFVNAWNEWAEGTHLEPDRRFGYAYLKATYDSVKEV